MGGVIFFLKNSTVKTIPKAPPGFSCAASWREYSWQMVFCWFVKMKKLHQQKLSVESWTIPKNTFISDVLWNHFVVENSKFRMLKSDVGRFTYNWSSTKNLGPKTPHQPPTVSISPGGEEIYQQGLHVPRSFQSKGHHPRSAKENTCFCLKNQN